MHSQQQQVLLLAYVFFCRASGNLASRLSGGIEPLGPRMSGSGRPRWVLMVLGFGFHISQVANGHKVTGQPPPPVEKTEPPVQPVTQYFGCTPCITTCSETSAKPKTPPSAAAAPALVPADETKTAAGGCGSVCGAGHALQGCDSRVQKCTDWNVSQVRCCSQALQLWLPHHCHDTTGLLL
jgi:hypothetical protein